MLERHIDNYHFVANAKNGVTIRWGKNISENPTWAPIPELADISISNHCTKGCRFCYRESEPNNKFMTLEQYCKVLDAMNHPEHGNVFQVALGGGEPLEHPHFREIIDATCDRNIVPNFTTNGIHLTKDICKFISRKVGAVAISTISIKDLPISKIEMLKNFEIRTNIHYVLSSENLKEACDILLGKFNNELSTINALVFLTYKPAGRAMHKNIIKNDIIFREFVSLIDNNTIKRPKIGFDACFVPMILRYTHIRKELIDTCEGAFFSVYIDHKLNVSPCSFSSGKDSYSLYEYPFYDIWLNKFAKFRNHFNNNCKCNCEHKSVCHGACPYFPEITICHE